MLILKLFSEQTSCRGAHICSDSLMLGHLQVILVTPLGEQSEAIIHEGSTVDWSLLV